MSILILTKILYVVVTSLILIAVNSCNICEGFNLKMSDSLTSFQQGSIF
jgi:hypothetical protein